MAVEPLTRRRDEPQRRLLRRLAPVEAQIDQLQGLGWPELEALLDIKDSASPSFVREETLVYLVRRALRFGRRGEVGRLFEVLFDRMAPIVAARVQEFDGSARDDAAAAIRDDLVVRLLDLSTDLSDFFQCLFFKSLGVRIDNVLRRPRVERERGELTMPLVTAPVEGSSQLEVSGEVDRARRSAFGAPDLAPQIRKGLELIKDERHREAFVLRHLMGLEVQEVAARMRVTEKTIFNWLRDAKAALTAAHGGFDDFIT